MGLRVRPLSGTGKLRLFRIANKLPTRSRDHCGYMSGHLTADEWRRINEFADTPKHRRRPEQLLPEGVLPDEELSEN